MEAPARGRPGVVPGAEHAAHVDPAGVQDGAPAQHERHGGQEEQAGQAREEGDGDPAGQIDGVPTAHEAEEPPREEENPGRYDHDHHENRGDRGGGCGPPAEDDRTLREGDRTVPGRQTSGDGGRGGGERRGDSGRRGGGRDAVVAGAPAAPGVLVREGLLRHGRCSWWWADRPRLVPTAPRPYGDLAPWRAGPVGRPRLCGRADAGRAAPMFRGPLGPADRMRPCVLFSRSSSWR